MIWFILWLALSSIPAIIASKKGRSGVLFFILGCVITPILATICAIAAKPNLENIDNMKLADGQYKKCPFCVELIKSAATTCLLRAGKP